MRRQQVKQYLSFFVIAFGLLSGVTLLFNAFVDPLWYFSGNKLTSINLVFNEREAKLNLFYQDPTKYNCVIFGSSRTTLLDQRLISGYSCFNFAFSAGLIGEFLYYSHYLRERGFRPRLVIVGVDGQNFFSPSATKTVPAYVIENTSRPSFIKQYLTLGALEFSSRTVRGQSPLPRYYDTDFVGRLIDPLPVFNPETVSRFADDAAGNFVTQRVQHYAKLKELFPEAKFVYYVPPVSVWHIRAAVKANLIEDYIKGVYLVSQLGSPLYDFSIPSSVTSDINNTYDGSHYSATVNRAIALAINGEPMVFGIRVDTLLFEHWLSIYRQQIENTSSPIN